MPRSSTLLLGIVLFLGACASAPDALPATPPSPPPTSAPATASGLANAPWPLDLALTGDLSANVTGTAPGDPFQRLRPGPEAEVERPLELPNLGRPAVGQRPFQVGLRFSKKAVMPSWASSLRALVAIASVIKP